MNVQVLSQLHDAQRNALANLLARCAAADGYAPLSETQRAAGRRADLGGHGIRMLAVFDDAALTGCAFLTPNADGSTAIHLALDPEHGRTESGSPLASTLLASALDEIAGEAWLWIPHAGPTDDTAVAPLGFVPGRDLLQMRVPLPLAAGVVAATRPVATRAFVIGRDEEDWLAVNNLAFAGHPEQGNWTRPQLDERLRAPWVDLNGFRLADAPAGQGLIGSCWTKVHRTAAPVVGEIYIISVNPAHHGEGWGRALTVTGLAWLVGQGVADGMLYTDASNTAAVTLYQSLGFTIHHIDRAYRHAGPTPQLS